MAVVSLAVALCGCTAAQTSSRVEDVAVSVPPCEMANSPAAWRPGGAISIALLDAEILLKASPEKRTAVADTLDVLLTDSLAGRIHLTVIDRQSLNMLLAEQALVATGAAEAMTEPLRRLRSAGVLICCTVQPLSAASPQSQEVLISIEAVAAQTGQVLAEIHAVAPGDEGKWQETLLDAVTLEAFWDRLEEVSVARAGSRLVEVSDCTLVSRLTRLQWMTDSVGDRLRASVAAQSGLTLLVPRHPTSTREERFLRLIGLASADPADPCAGLMAVPDVKVETQLSEEINADLEYARTPIEIKVAVKARGEDLLAEKVFCGMASEHEGLSQKAASWLASQFDGGAGGGPADDDDERCRMLARQELAKAGRLIGKLGGEDQYAQSWGGRIIEPLRFRIFQLALRAAHLDPVSEEAMRLVVLGIDSRYAMLGQEQGDVSAERVFQEGQRYMDRFPRGSGVAKVRNKMAGLAFQKLSEIRHRGSSGEWLGLPYNPAIYRNANVSLLNIDHDLKIPINLWVQANVIGQAVFGHCPAERLDEELAFWRDYWQKKVLPQSGDLPPWEFVELGYHIRKQDWKSLRINLTALAAKYPRTHANIWWGVRLWPEGGTWEQGKPCWKVRLSRFLRWSGDPEWQSWEPPFTAGAYGWDTHEYARFLAGHNPLMPATWDHASALPLPAQKVVLDWADNADALAAQEYGFEPLLVAGGFMWLAVPAQSNASRSGSRLFVVPIAALMGAADSSPARPVPVDWPAGADGDPATVALIRCWADGGDERAPSVWIGTGNRGLARFDLDHGGRWTGRWYTSRDGLPADEIHHIAPCTHGGRSGLLILCRGSEEMFLVALEADGKPVLLVACDAKSWPSSRWFPHGYVRLAVTRRDGTRLPLHACDRRMFPELDAGDIVGVGPYGKNHRGEFHLMDTDDTLRLWLAGEQTIVELGLDLAPRLIGPKMLPLSGCILFRSPRSPKDGIFLASRTGSVLWQVPQGPEFDILCTMPSPSIIWCAAATEVNHRLKGSRMICAYIPATEAPAEEHDAWLGPWQVPDGLKVRNMTLLAGHLWLVTTDSRLYQVDGRAAIEQAREAEAHQSTMLWRKAFNARLTASPWPTPIRLHIAASQWNQALAAVETRKETVGSRAAGLAASDAAVTDLLLWEALLWAGKGEYDRAEQLYTELIKADGVNHCAVGQALANLINVRHAAKRWDAIQETVDQFASQFGDATAPFGNGRQLQWFAKDARKHQASLEDAGAKALDAVIIQQAETMEGR